MKTSKKSRPVFVLAAPRSRSLSSKKTRGLYLKEILREGRYVHPDTGQELDATPAEMRKWASNTKRMMAAGVKVWLPDTHSSRAGDNVGFVKDVMVMPSPGKDGRPDENSATVSLYARIQVLDEEYLDKIGTTIRDVSIGLAECIDGYGVNHGVCVYHVALTPSPVAHEQENFVALAKEKGRKYLLFHRISENAPMKTKRRTFSVGHAAPAVVKHPPRLFAKGALRKAFEKFGVTFSGDRVSRDDVERLLEKIGEKSAPASIDEAAIVKHFSVDPKVGFAKEFLASRETAIDAVVADAKKSGRLTEDMGKAIKTLLSIRHGFALSKDGAASAVDVEATVKALLAAIPENAAVPLDKRLSKGHAAGGPPNEPEGLDDTKVKEHVDAALSRMAERGDHHPKTKKA